VRRHSCATFAVRNGSPDGKKETPVEITEDISAAISQHEEAVNAVSEALGPYGRDSAAPAGDADAEGQLDRAREQYERTSLLLSGLIVQRLIVVPEDAQRGSQS
jgi:hypothetical protein